MCWRKTSLKGNVFISVNDYDKEKSYKIARDLSELDFLSMPHRHSRVLWTEGLQVKRIFKVGEEAQ